MSNHWRRSLLAATAAASLLVGACAAPRVQSTDAAFVDLEQAIAPEFKSASLATPNITSCTVHTLLNLGLVFTGFTIVWTSPYPSNGVQLRINGVLITSNIEQSGSGPYTYTAYFPLSLLESLLGGLLGSTNTVTVQAVYPGSSWTSPAATRTLRIGGVLGLLGANNCTA